VTGTPARHSARPALPPASRPPVRPQPIALPRLGHAGQGLPPLTIIRLLGPRPGARFAAASSRPLQPGARAPTRTARTYRPVLHSRGSTAQSGGPGIAAPDQHCGAGLLLPHHVPSSRAHVPRLGRPGLYDPYSTLAARRPRVAGPELPLPAHTAESSTIPIVFVPPWYPAGGAGVPAAVTSTPPSQHDEDTLDKPLVRPRGPTSGATSQRVSGHVRRPLCAYGTALNGPHTAVPSGDQLGSTPKGSVP